MSSQPTSFSSRVRRVVGGDHVDRCRRAVSRQRAAAWSSGTHSPSDVRAPALDALPRVARCSGVRVHLRGDGPAGRPSPGGSCSMPPIVMRWRMCRRTPVARWMSEHRRDPGVQHDPLAHAPGARVRAGIAAPLLPGALDEQLARSTGPRDGRTARGRSSRPPRRSGRASRGRRPRSPACADSRDRRRVIMNTLNAVAPASARPAIFSGTVPRRCGRSRRSTSPRVRQVSADAWRRPAAG